MRALRLAVPALVLAAAPLAAQLPRDLAAGLGFSSTRLHADVAQGRADYSGVTVSGTVRIRLGRVGLEGGYRQGSLTPDSGAAVAQDLVEGRLMLAVRPAAWLSVLAGPHALAYVAPNGTERWLLYEARVRADGAVVGDQVRTHVELWTAFGGSVNIGSGAPSGRGGEAGLTYHLARSPAWVRLAYGIAFTKQSGATNNRSVEDLRVSVGIGGR